MPKRTAEQAIRDDWKAANIAVDNAKHRLEAIAVSRTNVIKAYTAQEAVLEEVKAQRKSLEGALEALLGEKIQHEIHEEESDGDAAAPAATGANAEVQPDGKDAKK